MSPIESQVLQLKCNELLLQSFPPFIGWQSLFIKGTISSFKIISWVNQDDVGDALKKILFSSNFLLNCLLHIEIIKVKMIGITLHKCWEASYLSGWVGRKKFLQFLWANDCQVQGRGRFLNNLEQHWNQILIGWGAKKISRQPEDRRVQERRCKRIHGILGVVRMTRYAITWHISRICSRSSYL